MLNEKTGSPTEFADLYDRMYMTVSRRDRDGGSQYAVYSIHSRESGKPAATFDFGAGGALGNITITDFGGSSRIQTIAAFLVEVGG